MCEYREDRAALGVYLAAQLVEAVSDLYKLHPYEMPGPAALFDRFLGWTARR